MWNKFLHVVGHCCSLISLYQRPPRVERGQKLRKPGNSAIHPTTILSAASNQISTLSITEKERAHHKLVKKT